MRSEVLFYIVGMYGDGLLKQLKMVVLSLYTEDEQDEARLLLQKYAWRQGMTSRHVVPCFEGKLAPDTQASDFHDLLLAARIKVIDCKMLKRTEEWHKKFAAFGVFVDITDKDNVFQETVWPEGADVRVWYFKRTSTQFC